MNGTTRMDPRLRAMAFRNALGRIFTGNPQLGAMLDPKQLIAGKQGGGSTGPAQGGFHPFGGRLASFFPGRPDLSTEQDDEDLPEWMQQYIPDAYAGTGVPPDFMQQYLSGVDPRVAGPAIMEGFTLRDINRRNLENYNRWQTNMNNAYAQAARIFNQGAGKLR